MSLPHVAFPFFSMRSGNISRLDYNLALIDIQLGQIGTP